MLSLAPYRAPFYLFNGHLQTLWPVWQTLRKPAIAWHRERWETPDGDFIDVDCINAGDADKPVVILFHGLEGSSQSHYARGLATVLQQIGWSGYVPHFRGCSGELNRQPRAYHSGDWQEVAWITAQMRARHTGPVYVVGVSLGGNALMRWAGELGAGAQASVNAIASICSPLDLVASGLALEQGLNRWIYTPMFLHTMKPKAREKWQQFPGLFDLKRALRARTLYEFDDAFTAPMHGFAGVMDYWTRASAKPHMSRIAVAALALNARNDPFMPASALPTPQEVSPHVTLALPDEGGHVGFPRGPFPGRLDWLPQRLLHHFRHQTCSGRTG